MTDLPTVATLKAIQAVNGLGDVHLVAMSATAFVMAHTDAERASGMDLEECSFHLALLDQEPFGPPDYDSPEIHYCCAHCLGKPADSHACSECYD